MRPTDAPNESSSRCSGRSQVGKEQIIQLLLELRRGEPLSHREAKNTPPQELQRYCRVCSSVGGIVAGMVGRRDDELWHSWEREVTVAEGGRTATLPAISKAAPFGTAKKSIGLIGHRRAKRRQCGRLD